jgi:hypothetical protein
MAVTLAVAAEGPGSAVASGSGWTSSVPFTNQVASSPANGGGYLVPPGRQQGAGVRLRLDRNPGDAGELDGCDRSERRVRHQGPGLSDDAAVQRILDGSTLRPDGAIDVSYSDDMGQHWVKGNGGQDLEQSPDASARQAGHVEDKQWIASHAAAVAAGRRGPAGDARHGPEDQRLGHHTLRRHVRPWRLPLPTTQ